MVIVFVIVVIIVGIIIVIIVDTDAKLSAFDFYIRARRILDTDAKTGSQSNRFIIKSRTNWLIIQCRTLCLQPDNPSNRP